MKNKRSIRIWAGGVFVAGLPGAAWAQDEGDRRSEILVLGSRLDPLAVKSETGSRLGLTSLETPASIYSLDGNEIRRRGDLSVIEAVTRAPGISNVGNPGNGGTALAARGFSGQGSVLQLVDGIRLFPVAGTITYPTDPWTVERIEVLSGPASVLYGQGALGGAVNVVSKTPSFADTVFDAQTSYGSQATKHLAAGIGGPISDKIAYRIDASWRASDGYVQRGDSRSYAISGAIEFRPSEAFSIRLRNDYGNSRPTEYFGTPLINGVLDDRNQRVNYNVADASLYFRDNRSLLTIDWHPSEAVTVVNTAYRLSTRRFFANLESYAFNAVAGLVDRSDNLGIDHDQVQWGNQGSIKLSTGFSASGANDFVIGFDVNSIKLIYGNDFGSDPQGDSVDPFNPVPGLFLDTQGIAPRYRTRTNEWAIFAEDRLKISEQLSIVGGVRYERDSVRRCNFVYMNGTPTACSNAFPNGNTARRFRNTTWRVGVVYRPVETISLYGQYATGVDPLGTLTTYTTNATQFAFTNATGDQIEAGVKASFLNGRGSATVAVYKIVKNGLVSKADNSPTTPIDQVGQRSAKGIEVSLTLALPGGFSIDANGTLVDAKYDDFVSGTSVFSGNTPPGVPQEAANLALSWDAFDKLQLRGLLRYVGSRYQTDANTSQLPSYTVIDAGVSYAFSDQVAVDLRAFNLFNKDYAVTQYNPGQFILGRPRSFDIALRARF